MLTMTGTINITERAGVRVHTYTAPEEGMLVNTQIIEGPTQLVVFDGQFFLPYAQEAADYIAILGKPVERIIVSHIHPDHWSGLEALTSKLPGVPVYALAEVRDFMVANAQALLDARRSIYPTVGKQAVIPDHILAEGRQVIDGVTYDFRKYLDGESAVQLVALLPDQQILLSFDLIYPESVHVYTGVPFMEHWLELLQELERLEGYNLIIVGHGAPVDKSAIATTREFLQVALKIHKETPDHEEYARQLTAAFPDRQLAGLTQFSALMLYGLLGNQI